MRKKDEENKKKNEKDKRKKKNLPFVFNWTFLEPIPEGLADVDPNDWSMGSRLVIPSEYIEDRESFPMNEPVTFQVLL